MATPDPILFEIPELLPEPSVQIRKAQQLLDGQRGAAAFGPGAAELALGSLHGRGLRTYAKAAYNPGYPNRASVLIRVVDLDGNPVHGEFEFLVMLTTNEHGPPVIDPDATLLPYSVYAPTPDRGTVIAAEGVPIPGISGRWMRMRTWHRGYVRLVALIQGADHTAYLRILPLADTVLPSVPLAIPLAT